MKKSLIGCGYHGTHTPPVILRNVLENPGWYTAYTPYQAEIAQGRLEALLNFQTMVCDLTGMPIANASLLDEATAAAEAMAMAHALTKAKSDVHRGRDRSASADPRGAGDARLAAGHARWSMWRPAISTRSRGAKPFALVLQYPGTTGAVRDLRRGDRRRARAPARWRSSPPTCWPGAADTARRDGRGHRRRLGAAIRRADGVRRPACGVLRDARRLQARDAGPAGRRVSVDAAGAPAMRLALQTREQHIRREKATSNICTAQVLLAVMAGFYAVWHGPEGLRRIARRVNLQARLLADAARARRPSRCATPRSSTRSRSRRGARRRDDARRRCTPASTCAGSTRPASASRSTRPSRATDLDALAGLLGGRPGEAPSRIPADAAARIRRS